MIIEILALSLAENGIIFRYNHLTGGEILKMAISRFIDVSEEKMVSQQILTTLMTRIVVDKSTDHAKPHSICFYHNIKDNEGNLCQDFLRFESARVA